MQSQVLKYAQNWQKKPPKKSQFFNLVESFQSKISCNFFENFDQCSSRRLPDYTNPNALEI